MEKKVNLDLVRIAAMLMVVSVHIGQNTGFTFSVGMKGVQLFFVLSGYLAFVSLGKNDSVKLYYKKRAIKIIPIYWFCLVLVYAKDFVLGIHSHSLETVMSGQCSPRFLRYFLFLQCFTPTDNWNLWNNRNALWAMSSFAGFYLLAPFLFKVMKRFYLSLMMLIALLLVQPFMVSTILQSLCAGGGDPPEAHIEWFASSNPLTGMYCFLLGSVLYVAMKEGKQNIYLLLIVIALVVSALGWYQYELLFIILIALAELLAPITKNKKAIEVISLLARGSFAVYLVHPMVLNAVRLLKSHLGWLNNAYLSTAALYILCLGIPYVLYYLIIVRIERFVSQRCGL